MYAVIRSGGKQYRVEPGATVQVEKLEGKVGGKVTFDVVAVRTDEKDPKKHFAAAADVAKAKVTGKIVGHGRTKKFQVLKFKKTRQYKIQRGHRQDFTSVEVGEIQLA
jgi:large subunit ribosomal protein L21